MKIGNHPIHKSEFISRSNNNAGCRIQFIQSMQSKDVLKEAIKSFDGTVIVVSHDREFLDGLVTKVYEFGHKKIKEHLGGIYAFLQSKKIENLQELERKTAAPVVKENTPRPATDNKADYAARKELSRQIKKLERQQQESEALIDKFEKELALLEISMAN